MKRILMYAFLIIFAFMLQNNFFAAIKWISITPNLLLIITFIFGFIRGKFHGMLIGFFAGLLTDFFFGAGIGYYALIYMLIGYANGLLGQVYYTDYLHLPVALCVVNDFIFSMYVYISSFLLNGATNFGFYLGKVILPEIIYTLILTLALYKPLQALDKWMEKTERRSAKKFV